MRRARFTSPQRSRLGLSPRETVFLGCVAILACLLIAQAAHLWRASTKDSTLTAVLSTTRVVRDKTAIGHKERKITTRTNLIIDGFHRDDKYSKKLQKSIFDEEQSGENGDTTGLDEQLQHDYASNSHSRGKASHIVASQATDENSQGPILKSAETSVTEGSLPKKGIIAANSSRAHPVKKEFQQAKDIAIPKLFDWETYLLYQPELRAAGVDTEKLAKQHYLDVGRSKGFVYKRLRVVMRYTACGGLINQQYSHIAAFSLAAVLGAELVLAPAVKRDSFAHYFSTFKEQNEVSWMAAPLESLLDVDAIVQYWANKSLAVHKVPGLVPFPDLTQPEVAFPMYNQPGVDPDTIARLERVYLQNLDMPELIEKARQAVIGHAGKLLRQNPDKDVEFLVLDLPCTFYMMRSVSALRVVTEVARSLRWSRMIESLAATVIQGMQNASSGQYNALHLRIEKDARDWSTIMGGKQAVWQSYVHAMRLAGFSNNTSVYVASGLLTYGAEHEMGQIIRTMKHLGLCSEVYYKEMYLPKAEVDGLNSEQKALVDFLVLSKGKAFVGFGSSTFSFYLREYRALASIPRSSSVLVDASIIGTDPLFHSAGTVV